MANQVSPQQRQAYFNQMTRQHHQTMPAYTGTENQQIQFQIPKVRLLSKVFIELSAILKVTHATATTYTPNEFAPYTMIDRVVLEMNNGFAPFTISGKELYMYALARQNAHVKKRKDSGRGSAVQSLNASAAGTDNPVRFMLELPLTLNSRDSIGLVLTQNQETTVTVTINLANGAKMLDNPSGYTAALSSIVAYPTVESFSVPANNDALPDISVLKIVQSTNAVTTAGQNQLKLPVGMTYRKLIFRIEDADGKGIPDADISGLIEIVMNQSDMPYRIKPSTLAAINTEQYGTELPSGTFVLDFSDNGVPNYGSARDYVDTERLTEFWIRLNTPKAGRIVAVYEMLSRLK